MIYIGMILIAIIACSYNLDDLKDIKIPALAKLGAQYMPDYNAKLTQYFDSKGFLDMLRDAAEKLGPKIPCKICWPTEHCVEFMNYLLNQTNN